MDFVTVLFDYDESSELNNKRLRGNCPFLCLRSMGNGQLGMDKRKKGVGRSERNCFQNALGVL